MIGLIDRFVATPNFWRHGRASRRASGRAADRARPRGLADGAGGPVQRSDEPQQGVPTAGLFAYEDEETAGLLLQAARFPWPLKTSRPNESLMCAEKYHGAQ